MEKEEKEDVLKDAKALDSMLRTSGWRNVLRPALERWKETNTALLLSATEHIEMVKHQQRILIVDELFGLIRLILNTADDLNTPEGTEAGDKNE